MKRLLVLLALLPALLALNSCGGTPAAAPTISVTGTASSVNLNGTVQFTATIFNLSSTLVNWQVNGIPSGNSEYGTIDTNGLYTAPSPKSGVPTNNVVTITAVAQADTSLTATANLTILPAAAISGVSCVNPQTEQPSQTVASGASLLCTPTVTGGGNIAVYLVRQQQPHVQLDTLANRHSLAASTTLGKITGTQQGNYVGPQIPPPGAAVAITAVSQVDSTQAFCIPVTLTFGNASLQGSYAFSTSGRVIAGNSFFARAGSFTANGTGGLIGGHRGRESAAQWHHYSAAHIVFRILLDWAGWPRHHAILRTVHK